MTERSTKRKPSARTGLSREAIIDGALALLATGDIASLTMAALAKRLGVGVMTLYWYFASKDELLSAITARLQGFFAREAEGLEGVAWDDFLARHFGNVRAQILERPWLGALLLSHGRLAFARGNPEPLLRSLEQLIETMVQAGFTPEVAMRGVQSVSAYTLGFALREATRQKPGSIGERGPGAGQEGPAPARIEVLAPLLAGDGQAQFEFGLGLILEGMRRQISPPAPSAS